ncbi:FAR1 DNA-binding domain [Sesbania bispinosa]|nr:FAR1 DNA-binding domain [Sesbania bispinosa]
MAEDVTYHFYNSYAYRVGFSVRISKGHKGHDGKMIGRVFCCSCEGYREKDKREANTKNPRAQTRFGCLAKMKVNSRSAGKYRVTEFVDEHTHETTTPRRSHLLRSQRKITTSEASEVDLAEIYGITPKASCELMARRVGGRENLGFIPEDYRNYLRSKRTIQMRSGDTVRHCPELYGATYKIKKIGTRDLPRYFSQIELHVVYVIPITGSPSIANPSKSATSLRVTVISPTFK